MDTNDTSVAPAPDGHSIFRASAIDRETRARTGTLQTRRGPVATPAFMPVGTQATVKALTPEEVRSTGAEIILANTYHLMLRPGRLIMEQAGGVQSFMGWRGPLLTDSGGFQIFSLANHRVVREEGVLFRSHLDGSPRQLTPEEAVDLQLAFESDIVMPLDDLVGFASDERAQRGAMERTHRWLERSVAEFRRQTEQRPRPPLLFGIAQGGFEVERRRASADVVAAQPVDGCAIGGLSVGEPKPVMDEMLHASVSALPLDKPRYLMGVGSPEDLWRGVAAGIDMFDCVLPTRVARRGALFTRAGRINVTNARFKGDFGAVDPSCDCIACRDFSVAYLHHLFRCRELLAYRLATIHNLRFIQRLMADIRSAIIEGRFAEAARAFLSGYQIADQERAVEQRHAWRAGRRHTEERS